MANKKEDAKTTKVAKKKVTPGETSTSKAKKAPTKAATKKEAPVIKKRTTPDEASSPVLKKKEIVKEAEPKKEEKNDKPSILKKRELPGDAPKTLENKSDTSSILKKRELPGDAPKTLEKKSDTSSILKKRELPGDAKVEESSPLKKKINLSDQSEPIFTKTEKESSQEKSSLDKMRERIAAQKKLEQDMMTQQVLRNQEKEGLRSKLSKLNKELVEEEQPEMPKANISFDLKSEALETQNKKLKQDIEKLKNQLQALLALEFMDLKVLDPNNLTLANDFVEAVNNIKDQVELQKDKEEQSLKDELQSLQFELDNLRAKNEEAKKASTDIKRVAQQTQKALDEAKKAIQEQETDEVRDFKQEINALHEQLEAKTKELETLQNEKNILKKNNEDSIKVLKATLEKQIEKLSSSLEVKNTELEKEKELNETITQETKKLEEQVTTLEQKIKEMNEENSNNVNLEKEKVELEQKLEEQASKVDTLLLEYQKQLDAKDKEIEELRKAISLKEKELNESFTKEQVDEKEAKIIELQELVSKQEKELSESFTKEQVDEKEAKITELQELVSKQEKELSESFTKDQVLSKDSKIEELQELVSKREKELLEISKQPDQEEIKALEDKCNQYQILLMSERDSHIQVEQKLCKDLETYKQEIVSLQAQVTNMSSDYGLTRLHKQIDSIEEFINEMKNNPDNGVNKNAYNEYYEKLIADYKLEEEKLITEINRRNHMLEVLRQEKLKVVEVLKKNSKNTSTIEKQIEDISNVINSKVEVLTTPKSEEIETQILNQIKEDLLKYCENIKYEASKELEKINEKYESSKTVSDLVNNYNKDFERMTKAFGNEISKLNIERSLSKDENTNNAIEEKMLMIEKQYKINTLERDRKFNESIDKLRKQSLEIVKEEIVNPYISVVGKEYIKSLNQYAEMKKNILDKLELVKKQYNDDIENIKNEEMGILKFNDNIKENIAYLNSQSSLTDEDNNKKNELLAQLKINEEKINNLYQYGYNVLKQETDDIVKKLEAEFATIIEDENRLRDLYAQREQEAKNRLEIEKAKEDGEAHEKALKQYNEYRYIEEEAERIIESVQERRERIHEQKIVTIEPEQKVSSTIEPVKNVIKSDINAIDYDKIKELQENISSLNYKLNETNAKIEEAQKAIERYKTSQKQSTTHREIRKYMECVKEYYALNDKANVAKADLVKLDERTNKKEFKAKRAEIKSLDNKMIYYAKQIKALDKKEVVKNYSKVSAAIRELNNKVTAYEKEKDNINLEINKCQLEINSLKQKN